MKSYRDTIRLVISDAFSGTFDRVFKVADVAGALATDKLGLQEYVEKEEFGDI